MPNESQAKILPTKNKTDFEELQALYEALYKKVVTVVNRKQADDHSYLDKYDDPSDSDDHSYLDEYDDPFDADTDTPTEPWFRTDHLKTTYESFRQEQYYQAIEKSIENKEHVSTGEYLFYALVTDNVSTLNPNQLEQHHDIQLKLTHPYWPDLRKSILPFLPNIKILAAALRHQNNPKNKTLKKLSLLLDDRNQIQKNRLNLNLSGIDLPGINMQLSVLKFDDCYFADTKFDPHLNFKASYCVFLRTQLSVEPKQHQRYRYCTLINIDATIHYLDNDLKLDHLKFHQCKLTFKTNRKEIMLDRCIILESHIDIQTRENRAATRLKRCKVKQSTLTLHESTMDLWKNTFTQTVITHNPTDTPIRHSIYNNVFYNCDLRSGPPVNPQYYFNSHSLFSRKHPSLIYGNKVFAENEKFNTLLSEHQAFFKGESFHKNTERIQKTFAHMLIAHIRLYYPVEAYPIEHVALLEQALKHPALGHINPYLEVGTPGHLFARCSSGKKARDALNKALNEALPDRSQHTALSRLASF